MRVLRNTWNWLSPLPMGKWLFSRILGLAVPYTGSLPLEVEELRPGYARVSLRDTWRARNHLKSVHAMALANLGELVTGLALNFGLPDGQRSILVAFEMAYRKKARGRLTAECQLEETVQAGNLLVCGAIKDQAGDVVAEVRATWKVSA